VTGRSTEPALYLPIVGCLPLSQPERDFALWRKAPDVLFVIIALPHGNCAARISNACTRTLNKMIRKWANPRKSSENSLNARQRNNVHISGRGIKPMIFAHGYGCDQNMWRFVAPAFEDSYRVVLFDHVGAGHSDLKAFDPSKYATLAGYATDLLEICDELALHNVIFVGHSVSSIIGVLAAVKEPGRFSALVLVGPSPCYINDGDYVGGFEKIDIEGLLDFLDSNHLGWSAQMAPVIMGNADKPELPAELENSFCRTDPEIAKHFARVTFSSDNRSDLSKVQTPTLILQCSQDAIAHTSVGEYVHRTIPGSRITHLSATGHCPQLSAPEETVEAIRNGLQAMRSARAT
jgi:sigma-B regulation protein RsbQ